MASESQIPKQRKSKRKVARIIDGGKKKFNGLAITCSVIDEVLTGKDINGSLEGEGAYIDSLKNYAGAHCWGTESAANRYHVRNPGAPYGRGKKKLEARNTDSKVDEVVFGIDMDDGDPDAWLDTEAYRGAFGGVSGKDYKDFGSSKRRFPQAPMFKSVVDEVIYGVDLDDSKGAKANWVKSMADHAGVSSWINANAGQARFDALAGNNAEDVRRYGKKLWAGCPNKVSTVDTVAFNHNIDGGDDDLDAYKKDFTTTGYAGRPHWDSKHFKDRFYPRDDREPHKLGKRRYADAPMAQQKQEVGARWSQVVDGYAGVPGRKTVDVMHGRYHKDRDETSGHVPGRRKVEGHPCQHDSSFQDMSFDCDSEESSVHAGRPELRIREVDVPEYATTNFRAVYQPPPRRALDQAARRAQKSKLIVTNHTGEGVADVLGGGPAARSSQVRRKKRPKSSPAYGGSAVGPRGPSMYNRDYRPMSATDLAAAFEPPYTPEIGTPQSLGTSGKLKDSKSRISQSTPVSADARRYAEYSQEVRSASQASLRSTPRGTPRGSPQGTPRGSDRWTPQASGGSRGQRGSARLSSSRRRP